ncbi:MFS transporter [Paenibacillus phoenicis]|uniref:MFS transporter n=1 Tax=Paenibacillus phoenicis TaxID=554117 RepID=A0ABU5PP48_9BACL|nr:MFS transporter [Paenibacillus phoenicis]MEA3571721.1 MFS transporter [Paenibacillus phoenicis]
MIHGYDTPIKRFLGTISLDLFTVLLGGATALLPIFAEDILHTGSWGLGLLRTAPAVGALLMSLVLTRYSIQNSISKYLFSSLAIFGLATVLFAVSKNLVLSLVALFLIGASDVVSAVIRSTLVQLNTPREMQGRVNAVNMLFIGTSNQLGEFESGHHGQLAWCSGCHRHRRNRDARCGRALDAPVPGAAEYENLL